MVKTVRFKNGWPLRLSVTFTTRHPRAYLLMTERGDVIKAAILKNYIIYDY